MRHIKEGIALSQKVITLFAEVITSKKVMTFLRLMTISSIVEAITTRLKVIASKKMMTFLHLNDHHQHRRGHRVRSSCIRQLRLPLVGLQELNIIVWLHHTATYMSLKDLYINGQNAAKQCLICMPEAIYHILGYAGYVRIGSELEKMCFNPAFCSFLRYFLRFDAPMQMSSE